MAQAGHSDSFEYVAFQECREVVIDIFGVQFDRFCDILFTSSYLPAGLRYRTMNTHHLNPQEKGNILFDAVASQIEFDRQKFHQFIDVLKSVSHNSTAQVLVGHLNRIAQTTSNLELPIQEEGGLSDTEIDPYQLRVSLVENSNVAHVQEESLAVTKPYPAYVKSGKLFKALC